MTTRKAFVERSGNPIKDISMLSNFRTEQSISKSNFIELCERHPDLQIEREKNGKLQIISPVKFGSGRRESIVQGYLFLWWIKQRDGTVFSASTGIDLPDGSTRSPDCGWVSDKRLSKLTEEELESDFLKVVPEFVTEVRSKTDSLTKLKKKMADSWMKNGVKLAWLIDPYKEKVYIYREKEEPEIIKGFSGKVLTGEKIMEGMECPLDDLKIKMKKKGKK